LGEDEIKRVGEAIVQAAREVTEASRTPPAAARPAASLAAATPPVSAPPPAPKKAETKGTSQKEGSAPEPQDEQQP